MALSHDDNLASLRTRYLEKRRQGFLSKALSSAECQELLLKMVSLGPKVILILDALDECDEDSRHSLIAVLNALVEHSPPVKILISSRRDDDITAEFEDKVNFSLSATDNSRDIMKFVRGKIEEYRKSKTARRRINSAISAELEEQIIEVFLDKSNGMLVIFLIFIVKSLTIFRFQWAALHIAHLLSLDRPSDIAKALPNLPRGLEKTYGEIFDRITSPDNSLRDIAIRTFHWMLARDGNADIEQLLLIVCQDPDNDVINPIDIDPETILKACQNLVVQEGQYPPEHDYAPPRAGRPPPPPPPPRPGPGPGPGHPPHLPSFSPPIPRSLHHGPPSPPLFNWPDGPPRPGPPPSGGGGNRGIGDPPVMVNLRPQPLGSRSRSRNKEPSKGLLGWMVASSGRNRRGRSRSRNGSPPQRD
jgi:hypothetical protein